MIQNVLALLSRCIQTRRKFYFKNHLAVQVTFVSSSKRVQTDVQTGVTAQQIGNRVVVGSAGKRKKAFRFGSL